MSSGQKAAWEEQMEAYERESLERLGQLKPYQLLLVLTRIEIALRAFHPESMLTSTQHDAIRLLRSVEREMRAGAVK